MNLSNIIQEIIPDAKGGNGVWNFRCPVCGDSQTNHHKRRGYILSKDNRINYYCHNCGASLSFRSFLKEYFPAVYQREYVSIKKIINKEVFGKLNVKIKEKNEYDLQDVSRQLNKIAFRITDDVSRSLFKSNLKERALNYIKERNLPLYDYWVGCKNIKSENLYFENRLVIPFYKDKMVYNFQGRSLCGQEPKYLTFQEFKIFNFFNVNSDEVVYIFEGPLDAMWCKNAIATCGAIGYNSEINRLIMKRFPNKVYCLDNDSDGIRMSIDFVKNGESVFIIPNNEKDISDFANKKNLTKEEIYNIISDNLFKGSLAITKLKLKRR